jgi:hypothetical protein
MIDLGGGLPAVPLPTGEGLQTLQIPVRHRALRTVIDDDAKLSSFLSFLNQSNGGGEKQAMGPARVKDWLEKKALPNNDDLREALLQVAPKDEENIDWERVKEIVKRQTKVRAVGWPTQPQRVYHSLSITHSLTQNPGHDHESQTLREALNGFLDRPEPKARREWDEPFAGLFMKALEAVVGDDGLSAAFTAAKHRSIFLHMQSAFIVMVKKGLKYDSTNPLVAELLNGDPGPEYGDARYGLPSLSDATTPPLTPRSPLLSLSLSLSLQERLRLFGEE